MKRKMILLLALLLIVVIGIGLVSCAGPQGEPGSGSTSADAAALDYYPLPDGTYGVKVGRAQYLTNITIPATYNGAAVTQILYEAFASCKSLTAITIPDSVTNIDSRAFYGCTALTSITIPDSVTRIGLDAFSGCTSLVYNEHNNGKYLGNSENLHLVLVDVIDPSATDFTIPDTTRVIDSWAFSGCTNLTSITIPDSVTSIGGGAFHGCTGLTSITIPDGVTSIGVWAFLGCSSLTSITIGNGVTSIGDGAFDGCSNLSAVYYTGTAEEWSQIDIGSYNGELLSATIYYRSEP